MRASVRLAAYGAGLVALFGVAAGVGAAAGPIDAGGDDHDAVHDAGDETTVPGHDHDGEHDAADSTTVPGDGHGHGDGLPDTTSGDDGADQHGPDAHPDSAVRLVAATTSVTAGEPFHYAFTVQGPGGTVVEFDELHERRLHLIVVSDDLVDFWHVHPEMTADGWWHIDLPALEARVYTLYADVLPTGGQQVTLRSRLAVMAGTTGTAVSPRELPTPVATADTGDLSVRMTASPAVGAATFQFEVSRGGAVVATEPYLGALGHLVAIRTSDLAYLHVHPLEGAGPEVRFAAALPSAGTYRLFLDVSVDGVVHTAAFTVDVPASPDAAAPTDQGDGAGDEPAHDHGEHGS